MSFLQTLDADMRERFIEFHKANPDVWEMFKRFAFSARESGRKCHSAKSIMERIRWEVETVHRSDFKINNNFTALYARMLVQKYPEFGEFFEFRELKRVA